MIRFGDLSREYQAVKEPIRAALDRTLESGWFILGREVEAFEREFAEYLGSGHVVGAASGTDALALSLTALGVGPGHEVITVPNTAFPTAAAILQTGARPVFVDIEPETGLMDPDLLDAAIGPRTRAVVPVHLYGAVCDMERISLIARERGVPVVEDACQAHGSSRVGRKAGTWGDLSAFSFYPSKNLGAYGDAGAVATDNPELAERVRRLRNYGQSEPDRFELAGVNSRLDELQAAILRTKLPMLEAWNRRRSELAAIYDAGLESLGAEHAVRRLASDPAVITNHHLYVVKVPGRRDRVRDALAREGIETRVHYPTLIPAQPALQRVCSCTPGDLPRAEKFVDSILSLPMYPQLEDREARQVVDAMIAVVL